jgi:DHA1 family quinolone resistance protein-like MFS transporter
MRKLDFARETALIKTGLLLSTAVFFFYTLAPDYRWVIPLQIMLAFSYSFLYVGDLLYLTKRNEEKAVSVGILNSILGVCIGLGPLFGGVISQLWSFEWVMYSASLLSFLGFLVMLKEE